MAGPIRRTNTDAIVFVSTLTPAMRTFAAGSFKADSANKRQSALSWFWFFVRVAAHCVGNRVCRVHPRTRSLLDRARRI